LPALLAGLLGLGAGALPALFLLQVGNRYRPRRGLTRTTAARKRAGRQKEIKAII